MGNQKHNTLVSVITAIILILLAVGGFGLIYTFTDGFNEDFKNFIVEYNGERIPSAGKTMTFSHKAENTFTVKYVFDAPSDEPRDYNVKIMAGGEKDFAFTVDEQRYSWLALGDITSAFELKKEASAFTLTIPDGYSAQKVLETLYKGKTVNAPPDEDLPTPFIYTLVISSYNDTVTYRIDFSILCIGIELSHDHIVF